MSKPKKRSSKRNYKKFILAFWLFFFSCLIAVGIFGFVALGYMGAMPPLNSWKILKTNLATQILSSDGVVPGKFTLTTTVRSSPTTNYHKTLSRH